MMRYVFFHLALIASIALIVMIALTINAEYGIWYAILFLVIEAVKDLTFCIFYLKSITRD